MKLLVGLLLALNIGAIIYALIDIVKSNFHRSRQVKTGWIWVVILFQGPGSLIYFLTKEKKDGLILRSRERPKRTFLSYRA